MPQVYAFLKPNTYIAITRDAQEKRITTSLLLRRLAEKKYGGAKP